MVYHRSVITGEGPMDTGPPSSSPYTEVLRLYHASSIAAIAPIDQVLPHLSAVGIKASGHRISWHGKNARRPLWTFRVTATKSTSDCGIASLEESLLRACLHLHTATFGGLANYAKGRMPTALLLLGQSLGKEAPFPSSGSHGVISA